MKQGAVTKWAAGKTGLDVKRYLFVSMFAFLNTDEDAFGVFQMLSRNKKSGLSGLLHCQ